MEKASMRCLLALHVVTAGLITLASSPWPDVQTVAAAPVPKHLMPKTVYYFPTTVGSKWVYDFGGREETLVVSKVDDRSGEKLVSVDRVADEVPESYQVMAVSDAGLSQLSYMGVISREPELHLRAPVQSGEWWNTNDTPTKVKRKVVEVKEVKVPAGVFKAVHVECTSSGEIAPGGYRVWYAGDVGVVKAITGSGVEKVLKSFTPGPAK